MDAPEIRWLHDWDEAIALARRENRVILADVERENWIACELLDAVTYPDRKVRAAIASRFIPVRLDIKHPKVRDFSVIWMPTLLIADKRGVVHYRSVSSLPPEDLLDVLDSGEAQARMRSGEYARAEDLLVAGLARRERGPMTDELIFWHGIARYYLERQHHAGRDRIWRRLLDEFPDSIWTHRVPSVLKPRR